MISERKLLFSSFDGTLLEATIFEPKNYQQETRNPAVIFLFGGGWMDGTKDQFRLQALAMTEEGYFVITPDYRVFLHNGTTIETAMKDVFYFLRFLDQNCDKLGVDSQKIVLCGASAGGQLALSSMMLNQMHYNLNVNGMILFNPVVDTSENGFQSVASMQQDFDTIIYSPLHHLRKSLPPMLIFHGTGDTVVPCSASELFVQKNRSIGNQVEFVTYPMREHGFFNIREGNQYADYVDTLARSIAFCKMLFD